MLSCRHRVQQGHKITWNLTTTDIDAGTDTDIIGTCATALTLPFHIVSNTDAKSDVLIANECDGNLTPFYSKERPMKDGKYYLLGKILTSPKKLRTLAMNHEDNGKPYIATFNNCQEWVKGIANKLGRTIANKIKEHKSLLEVNPPFAFVVGVSSMPFHFSSKVLETIGVRLRPRLRPDSYEGGHTWRPTTAKDFKTLSSQRQIRSPLFFMEVVTLAFMSQPVARTLDTCVVLPASSWVKMSMSTDKVVGTTLSFLH
uniref:Uncharacterized protein n=1 Tax=Timema cristinae TaxID=61476 RepID=A0A7R9H5J3_TIMCR|nr:unnamed protein product [Timema cristinae]